MKNLLLSKKCEFLKLLYLILKNLIIYLLFICNLVNIYRNKQRIEKTTDVVNTERIFEENVILKKDMVSNLEWLHQLSTIVVTGF